jgi:outer membrane protein OmpA-like peptidoglycan-associated protein
MCYLTPQDFDMNQLKVWSFRHVPHALLALMCLAAPVWAQTTTSSGVQSTTSAANKTTPKETAATNKYGVGRPMGDVYAASTTVPSDQSRLVVYRNPNAKQQSVMTVYVNGSYHTSLMQAGFSKICLPDPSIHVRTRLRPVNQPVNVEQDKTVSLMVNKGQTQYVRVTELADGASQMELVTAKVAATELPKTREQMHALSRVEGASTCEDTQTADSLNGVVLVAYIEFESGRSRLTDLNSTGLRELDHLVQKLKSQPQTQEQMNLQVVGYANDGDKKTPSKQLAQSRAKTVEDYILSHGVKPKTLNSDVRTDKASVTGAGKANSVVVVSATIEQP